MNSKSDDQQKLMDAIYWHGIPTLFRCPYNADPRQSDIGLIGVPHSTGNGTTQRDQHLGPRAVRNISAIGRRVHNEFKIDPWQLCRINDLGDVPMTHGNDNEKTIEIITEYYKTIDAAGCRPVSIGGDHSITGGILQGIAGSHSKLTNGEKASLLHLDAHTDAFHNVDHDEMGPGAVIKAIDETIGDRPLYITFDLDCLDPTVAPGVSNIEAGIEGFGMDQVRKILQSVRGKNVIGGDVVCLMPTVDTPKQITSYRAMAVMFEILSLVADNKGVK